MNSGNFSILDHLLNKKASNKKSISVEILPPRNGENITSIYKVMNELSEEEVDFVSVTHGAGGGLRGGTEAIAALIRERYHLRPLVHLTCLDISREMVENSLMVLKYLGLNDILALRGDPPIGVTTFSPHTQGHSLAKDLIDQIGAINRGEYRIRVGDHQTYKLPPDAQYRKGELGKFSIWAACYPEGHPEGSSIEEEVEYSAIKVLAGTKVFITQMVFDVDIYSNFVTKLYKRLSELGIAAENFPPVIPGIMPIHKMKQIPFFERRFHVTIPERFHKCPEIKTTAELCNEMLFKAHAPGIHLFSLNEGLVVKEIIKSIKK